MFQFFLNNIILWTLFFLFIANLILFLIELKNQQQQSDKTIAVKIVQLYNEIRLLNIQLKTITK